MLWLQECCGSLADVTAATAMAAPLPTPPAQGIAPAAAAQMPSGGEETLHQKRTKIVQELKQTEATYISALEALVNVS